jgi:hypothetical protein
MKDKRKLVQNTPFLLWRDLLDLGVNCSLANLRKKVKKKL